MRLANNERIDAMRTKRKSGFAAALAFVLLAAGATAVAAIIPDPLHGAAAPSVAFLGTGHRSALLTFVS